MFFLRKNLRRVDEKGRKPSDFHRAERDVESKRLNRQNLIEIFDAILHFFAKIFGFFPDKMQKKWYNK